MTLQEVVDIGNALHAETVCYNFIHTNIAAECTNSIREALIEWYIFQDEDI